MYIYIYVYIYIYRPESFLSPSGFKSDPAPIPIQLPPGVQTTSTSLDWLMRLPWNIELQVDVDGKSTDVPLDTYIDTSFISNHWVSGKQQCSIRVKGNILSSVDKREKLAVVIPAHASLNACLFFGGQSVARDGKVQSCDNPLGSDWQRNSMSLNMSRQVLSATRLNTSLDMDWSRCPYDQITEAIDLGRHEFCIPGERVVWSFLSNKDKTDKEKDGEREPKLLSVSFILSFRTNPITLVPSPIHLYGELGSNSVGCKLLAAHSEIRKIYFAAMDPNNTVLTRSAALWALGMIYIFIKMIHLSNFLLFFIFF